MLHECTLDSAHEGYGSAVDNCDEHSDGTLWVSNGEYGSQVNFCPVCGYEAKVKVAPNPTYTPPAHKPASR